MDSALILCCCSMCETLFSCILIFFKGGRPASLPTPFPPLLRHTPFHPLSYRPRRRGRGRGRGSPPTAGICERSAFVRPALSILAFQTVSGSGPRGKGRKTAAHSSLTQPSPPLYFLVSLLSHWPRGRGRVSIQGRPQRLGAGRHVLRTGPAVSGTGYRHWAGLGSSL